MPYFTRAYTYEGGPLDGQPAGRTSTRGEGFTKWRDANGQAARGRDVHRHPHRGWYARVDEVGFDTDARIVNGAYRWTEDVA